jgi:hypothetical protein
MLQTFSSVTVLLQRPGRGPYADLPHPLQGDTETIVHTGFACCHL